MVGSWPQSNAEHSRKNHCRCYSNLAEDASCLQTASSYPRLCGAGFEIARKSLSRPLPKRDRLVEHYIRYQLPAVQVWGDIVNRALLNGQPVGDSL